MKRHPALVPLSHDHHQTLVVVGVAGSGTLTVDGEEHECGAGTATLVAKGSTRRIEAGAAGIRYLTVQLRRGGLSIAPRGD